MKRKNVFVRMIALLLVLATAAMLFGQNASLVLDIPVMLAVMLLLTMPTLMKKKLSRWQGILLLGIYAAFCIVQFTL